MAASAPAGAWRPVAEPVLAVGGAEPVPLLAAAIQAATALRSAERLGLVAGQVREAPAVAQRAAVASGVEAPAPGPAAQAALEAGLPSMAVPGVIAEPTVGLRGWEG